MMVFKEDGKISRWLKKPWAFPLVLAGVLVLAYGFQISQLGFYWDDWEDIFLYRLNSPVEFLKYFIYDRPTTIWVYLVFFPLFGDDPARWQFFNLLLRYLSLLGLWWTFRKTWPSYRYETGWLMLLLAVYPGFLQQTISVTYSRHFFSLTLFSLSLIFTMQSVQHQPKYVLFTLLAAVFSFAQMMTIEYFVGLEILRPLLLWVVFRDSIPGIRKRIIRVLQWWIPYLIPLAGFIVWRFILFTPVPGADDPNNVIGVSQFLADPIGLTFHLIQNVLQDCLYQLVFIWSETINASDVDLASKAAWFGWVIGGLAALAAGIVLGRQGLSTENNKEHHKFIRDWLIMGGILMIAGGLPVWITDRQIIVGLWSDRFSLGLMPGVCMVLVALVSLLGYRQFQRSVLLGVLVALSISLHIRTVNSYRLNWDIQRNYYWQFYWRVPAMKPGTALFGTKMPFGLIADYSVSYAMNAIYAPGLDSRNIPYWFFSSMRAYGNDIPDFVPDLPVKYSIRNLKFEGSTSNGIVTHYKAGQACVRILQPDDKYSPLLTKSEINLAQISNLDQILEENSDPRVSPVGIFGPEPVHGWCYFYQKADLARQFEEWDDVVALGDEAFGKGLSPAVGMEYEPFIEGYANAGQWETAFNLTERAAELTNNMEGSLCSVWRRLETIRVGNTSASEEWKNKVYSQYQCELFFNQSP